MYLYSTTLDLLDDTYTKNYGTELVFVFIFLFFLN